MRARTMLVCYAVWMAVLTAAFFALPGWGPFVWAAIGVSSVAAILVGVLRHRPYQRLPWLLLAGALATFAAGDATYNVLIGVLGQENPFPSLADGFYLLTYPLGAAALATFVRSRSTRLDRGRLLDALTLTAGLALLVWIFLIVPYVQDPDLTNWQKAISIAYPLGDVLLLAMLIWLVIGRRRHNRSIDMLVVGTTSLLVFDIVYGFVQLHGGWSVGTSLDLGWIVFYAAWGAAGIVPSMRELTEPVPALPAQLRTSGVVMLALASLIAPAVLLWESLTGGVRDGLVIAVLSGLMFLLVLVRLSGVVVVHREAVERERRLRAASGALVSAADLEEVRSSIRAAVTRLFPPGTGHRVLLTTAEPGLEVAGLSSDLRLAQRATGHPTRLVRTADLPASTAARLSGFTVALLCPLDLHGRAVSGPPLGTVIVAADEAVLTAQQSTLEVLASQGSLAVERVALTQEINRRESEAYFRTLVQNTADVILIVDADDRVRYASPSARVVFGDVCMVDEPVTDLIGAPERARFGAALAGVRAGQPWEDDTTWHATGPHRTQVELEATCRDLRADPTVHGLVLTLRDVTERRRLERDLRHSALHDPLTGLPNRALFRDHVEDAVQQSRGGSLAGVLLLDVDDFKVVNDTLGHTVGDQLLVGVAERLAAELGPGAVSARLGGDEFAALVCDVTDAAEIEAMAGRLVVAFTEPFEVDGGTASGMVSVGVATTDEAGDVGQLLSYADIALYSAKRAGKGRWRRYESGLHAAMLERLELRAALDRAFTEDAFTLLYQPIVRIRDGGLVGFEALVRWEHPTRGAIPTAELIEIAEETGLVLRLGRRILDRALAEAATWSRDAAGADQPYLSVNVSAAQLQDGRFVDFVRATLQRVNVPPQLLMLEITESILLRNEKQVWVDLMALRAMGVRIAIDDFGTGYSALSYLQHFPVDILKLDKTFIDDLAESETQQAFVQAILRLAAVFNMNVIAEGVEDPAQRDVLAGTDCRFGQGHLFAPPLPAGGVAEWLAHRGIPAAVGPNGGGRQTRPGGNGAGPQARPVAVADPVAGRASRGSSVSHDAR
ncbi:MAG TPA: bifunctional diguanylate cyclase/phosphodiesterase [Cryptosporangiaceae bacterium]|nr:bifunctional diguanylate cyclase/phosphodiesterase [Cryptosporangiaceae bacterium]